MSIHTPPKARPAAAGAAIVVSLLLVALAVVAVRDLAVSQGWTTGSPWSLELIRALDGLTASTLVLVIGIAVGLIGLLLVWLALKPARRTHLRATNDSDLWLSTGAVAALAQGIADRAPGVVSAEATRSSRRRITVEVLASSDADTVAERVRSTLQTSVQGLTKATISVRAKEVPR